MTNQFIKDLVSDAVSSACLTIQSELDIHDGGFAGMFFMDKEELDKTFEDYIVAEINNKINDLDEKLKNLADDENFIKYDKITRQLQYYKKLLTENK